jgi:hypothetical protein
MIDMICFTEASARHYGRCPSASPWGNLVRRPPRRSYNGRFTCAPFPVRGEHKPELGPRGWAGPLSRLNPLKLAVCGGLRPVIVGIARG